MRKTIRIHAHSFFFHIVRYFYGLRPFFLYSIVRFYNIPGSGLWITCNPSVRLRARRVFPMCSSWHSLYIVAYFLLFEITHSLVHFSQLTARSLRARTESCLWLYPSCLTQLLIHDLYKKKKKWKHVPCQEQHNVIFAAFILTGNPPPTL